MTRVGSAAPVGDQVGAVEWVVGLLNVREFGVLFGGEPLRVQSTARSDAFELLGFLRLSLAECAVAHLASDLVERVAFGRSSAEACGRQ
jgi:hypothetical protein